MSVVKVEKLDKAFDLYEAGDYEGAQRICEEILEIAPNDYGALYLSGTALAAMQRLDNAEVVLRRAIETDRSKKVAYYNLAQVLSASGDATGALETIRRFISLSPDDAQAHLLAGSLALLKEDLGGARESISRALKLDGQLGEAHARLGDLCAKEGDLDAAAASYMAALGNGCDDDQVILSAGNCLLALRRYPDLLHVFSEERLSRWSSAMAYYFRAFALCQAAQLAEAAAAASVARSIDPNFDRPYLIAALASQNLGQFEQALNWVEGYLKLTPQDSEGHLVCGNILRRLGRNDDALASLQQAISIRPEYAEAHASLGTLLQSIKRYDESLPWFDRALEIRPLFAEVYYNKAKALRDLGRLHDSIVCYDRAIEIEPHWPEAYFNRANALRESGRLAEAVQSYDLAILHRSDYAVAWANRGVALRDLDKYGEALASFERALELAPHLAEVHLNCGNALLDLGRLDEALEYYDRALALKAGYHDAAANRALCLLLLRRFDAAWTAYESRFNSSIFTDQRALRLRSQTVLFPSQEMLSGKRVLVIEEQAPGETIMFGSILGDLVKVADGVQCIVDQRLLTIMRRSFPLVQFFPWEAADDLIGRREYDIAVFTGSLGHAFRTSVEEFPGEPYLFADEGKVAAWRARLGEPTLKKVGISWKGGVATTRRHHRSIELAALAPILERQDCMFVSIQFGPVADEDAEYCASSGIPIKFFPPSETNDFDDLAALLSALDAVVTVQNTNVHLSGALGVRCHAILPELPEWRYGISGDRMPWYKSVQLHRRSQRRSLDSVVAEISAMISSGSIQS